MSATIPATQRPMRSRRLALTAAAVLIALLATLLNAGTAGAATSKATSTEASYATSVIRLLNAERKAHHLRALGMNTELINSARSHNLAMARANTMSHQLRGEAALGTRETRAGYTWHWAGENIGWSTDISARGVQQLEKAMYAEVAPNDGHKQNILSRHYRNAGIDVYIDYAHNKIWLTCDFGRH